MQIFISMIKLEFCFFQVKIERSLIQASKFGQPHLGYSPKILNAIITPATKYINLLSQDSANTGFTYIPFTCLITGVIILPPL